MLEHLKLVDVGPAPEMEIDFAPRLNFLTGDNGLGKTFLLDIAWWVITQTRVKASPHRRAGASPSITYAYETPSGQHTYRSTFDRQQQSWETEFKRPSISSLVVYARAEGGFFVWDPARNRLESRFPGEPDRWMAFIFASLTEVWNGLAGPRGGRVSNGLIADWASWQRENGEAFRQLTAVLHALSPSDGEPLVPGKLNRVSLDDVRDQPTLAMPYGHDVPLMHASAGMRRIVALAYLLVWTWQEHLRASDLLGAKPAREIIFLIDELEAHLHPQWQRRIVPALLDVMEALTGERDVPVQLIAATHSPLVLASVEPEFDEARDAVFHLDLQDGRVTLDRLPWAKQGDATAWLVSDVFGLHQARSLEAERAIESAEAWMRGDTGALPAELDSREKIHDELVRVLAGHDDFWPRWIVWAERHAAEQIG